MTNDIDPYAGYNRNRIITRQINELMGICKGTIIDGHVSRAEAEYIARWISANRECTDAWPANVLYPRLICMLEERTISAEDEGELLELLVKLTGETRLITKIFRQHYRLTIRRQA